MSGGKAENLKNVKDEIFKMMLNFFFACIYILGICLYLKVDINFSTEGILSGIYIGIFEMGLSFVFWIKALKLSETTDKVSNLIFIIPFISLIFIHFIVGEKIYITTFLGLLLIVIGIYYEKHKRK